MENKKHLPEYEHRDQPQGEAVYVEGRDQAAEPPEEHTQATEIECLEMMSRADRQHLLHKLLAVLEQELHDVQLLVLETVRQEQDANITEIMNKGNESENKKQAEVIPHRAEEPGGPSSSQQHHQGYLLHQQVSAEKVRRNPSS